MGVWRVKCNAKCLKHMAYALDCALALYHLNITSNTIIQFCINGQQFMQYYSHNPFYWKSLYDVCFWLLHYTCNHVTMWCFHIFKASTCSKWNSIPFNSIQITSTVLTKSKLMPRKGQIFLLLHQSGNLSQKEILIAFIEIKLFTFSEASTYG